MEYSALNSRPGVNVYVWPLADVRCTPMSGFEGQADIALQGLFMSAHSSGTIMQGVLLEIFAQALW